MNSILDQNISLKSLFSVLVVVCTLLLSGTTLYWSSKVNDAVKVEVHKQEQAEFNSMKAQLNRIEFSLSYINTTVTTLESYHKD